MADWRTGFDPYVRQRMAAFGTPGLATGFIRAGRSLHRQAYGLRNPGGDPVQADTLFGIGSITKSFTALAILQLEEQGRLAAEDPVRRHLPAFRLPGQGGGEEVRLGHLLTHTSGLPPLPALEMCLAHPPNGTPPKIADYSQLMDYLAQLDRPLLGPPGAYFSYSNEGYGLLGAVVEAASGEPYKIYVRRHILEPLGMRRSTFENPGANGIAGATELYDVRHLLGGGEEVFPSPGWSDAPAMIGAGWLRSTASDLLRYLAMYLGQGGLEGERVLSADGIAKMLRPRVETAPGRHYAYGFAVVRDFYGHAMVGHSGGLKGVGADVGFLPEAGLAGAALANLMGPAARQTVQGGLAFALEGLARPFHRSYRDYTVPGARLGDYLGTFPSGEGDIYLVAARDGRLTISDGDSSSDLRPVGEDAFLVQDREDDTFVRFWRRGGQVYAVSVGTRMVLRQPKMI